MPASTIAETASPAAPVSAKKATSVRTLSGAGITRSVISRGDAQRALGADERAEQVVARRVAVQVDDEPSGSTTSSAGHVVGREAVLEAVGAARVLGDVAADRADDLAGRVGRVEVGRGDRSRDGQVRDPRLHDHPLVVEVDREDPPHPREHDQDAVGHRQRAAGEAGPGTARHPRHPGLVAGADDARPRRRVAGEHRRDRGLRGSAAGRRSGRSRARADGSARTRDRRSRSGVRSARESPRHRPSVSLTAVQCTVIFDCGRRSDDRGGPAAAADRTSGTGRRYGRSRCGRTAA